MLMLRGLVSSLAVVIKRYSTRKRGATAAGAPRQTNHEIDEKEKEQIDDHGRFAFGFLQGARPEDLAFM